jgi:hypothetical protein
MKTGRKIQFLILIIAALALLGITGCLVFGGNSGNSSASDSAVKGSALVSDPHAGLAELTSYQMRVVNEFTGKIDGNPQQSRMEIVGDEVRSTHGEFVTITQSRDSGDMETLVMGTLGDASYRRVGDNSAICNVSWNPEKKAAPAIWPVDLLPDIIKGTKAAEEDIDAVKTIHYTLTRDSLGKVNYEEVSGDLWLAEPGGYVVKLDITISGADKTFGKGSSGSYRLTYELSKINANEDFALPAGCRPVMMDIPVMVDAENIVRMPDVVRYKTTSNLNGVVAFYKEKLGADGWQAGDLHHSQSGYQILRFAKSGVDESLHISLSEEQVGVRVSVAKVKPGSGPQDSSKSNAGNLTPEPPPSMNPSEAGLPEDVQIYPGAANFTGVPGMQLVFTTNDPINKVVDFYKTSLVKGKWAQLPGTVNVPGASLMFKKGNNMLVIRVTEQGGGSQVEIMSVKQ